MTAPEPTKKKVSSLDELVNNILSSHALELVEHVVEQLCAELVELIRHHSKNDVPTEQTIQAVKDTLNAVNKPVAQPEENSAPVEAQPAEEPKTDGN